MFKDVVRKFCLGKILKNETNQNREKAKKSNTHNNIYNMHDLYEGKFKTLWRKILMNKWRDSSVRRLPILKL